MSVFSALERELADVEFELMDLMMFSLPVCSKHEAVLFTNSQDVPDRYRKYSLPAESDKLYELATRCLRIRCRLGESSTNAIA